MEAVPIFHEDLVSLITNRKLKSFCILIPRITINRHFEEQEFHDMEGEVAKDSSLLRLLQIQLGMEMWFVCSNYTQ